jgi:hypothetical protein
MTWNRKDLVEFTKMAKPVGVTQPFLGILGIRKANIVIHEPLPHSQCSCGDLVTKDWA